MLRHGSHSFTYKGHHACLYLVSIHQMAHDCGRRHLFAAYYSFINPERMKGLIGQVTVVTANLASDPVARRCHLENLKT